MAGVYICIIAIANGLKIDKDKVLKELDDFETGINREVLHIKV